MPTYAAADTGRWHPAIQQILAMVSPRILFYRLVGPLMPIPDPVGHGLSISHHSSGGGALSTSLCTFIEALGIVTVAVGSNWVKVCETQSETVVVVAYVLPSFVRGPVFVIGVAKGIVVEDADHVNKVLVTISSG